VEKITERNIQREIYLYSRKFGACEKIEVNSVKLDLLSKRVYPSIHVAITMQSRDTAGSIKKEIKSPVQIFTEGRCDSMSIIFVSKSGCLHGISLGTISVIVSMDDAGCTESMVRLLNGGVLDEKAENSLVRRIPSHLVGHAKLFIYSEVFRNKAQLA
jgi:hypothetical protein